jgi:hypothetical protein
MADVVEPELTQGQVMEGVSPGHCLLLSQVLLATQSVTPMNQFELDDLIVVERQDGASVFERPAPERLGELWEKNMLGGRPTPERG